MKKAIIIVTFILFIGLLAFGMMLGNGILQEENVNYKSNFTELPANQSEMVSDADGYSVEEQSNGMYRCDFYGSDHTILRSEESYRIPHIEVLPSGYIKYVVQAGTGVGTQWGFFFDQDKEIFSESFVAILDQKDNLVALGTARGIVIRSIFNDSYCKEIIHFSQELASVVMPVFDAAFSEKEGFVSVSYYSGQEFQIVTEEIDFKTAKEEKTHTAPVCFYGETWQEVYKNVLFSHPCTYLPDPAPQTNMEDRWIYLGIHDFDGDDIPELIIGDGAAVAVFTFADGEAQKLVVLDIPDYVWCVNGLYFGDNSISALCAGSGGTDTVSFGFRDGGYVFGIYTERSNEYAPPQINGKPVTLEEMNRIYPVNYEDIPQEQQKLHVRLVQEDEQWVIYDMNGGKFVLSNPIDFNIFSWK